MLIDNLRSILKAWIPYFLPVLMKRFLRMFWSGLLTRLLMACGVGDIPVWKSSILTKKLNDEYLPKLQEYEKHLDTMGEINSYSKNRSRCDFYVYEKRTHEESEFKPGYNLQISTEKTVHNKLCFLLQSR